MTKQRTQPGQPAALRLTAELGVANRVQALKADWLHATLVDPMCAALADAIPAVEEAPMSRRELWAAVTPTFSDDDLGEFDACLAALVDAGVVAMFALGSYSMKTRRDDWLHFRLAA